MRPRRIRPADLARVERVAADAARALRDALRAARLLDVGPTVELEPASAAVRWRVRRAIVASEAIAESVAWARAAPPAAPRPVRATVPAAVGEVEFVESDTLPEDEP